MSYDIEKARKLVADIKSGAQSLNTLSNEIVKKAREYTLTQEKYRELLDFSAKFYNYSFNNCILIQMQNPHSTYVGSFKHFQKLGYSVKKGEHGIKILVPVKVKVLKQDGEIKKLSEATEEEKIKAANGELTVIEKTYFKPGTVFDISQTNVPQKDLPKVYGFMEEKPDSSMQYQCIYDIADQHGILIETEDLKSISLKGYYQPSDDKIVLNNRLNDANMVKTLTHEFAHALLHKSSRDMPKPQVEFEAESVAYMVLRQIDADLRDYQFDYIGQYFSKFKELKDNDLGASLRRINNTASYISGLYRENIKDYQNEQCAPEQEQPEMEQDIPIAPMAVFKHLKKENANEEDPFS